MELKVAGGMLMSIVSFSVPDEVIRRLRETESSFAEYIKTTIAVDLYKNREVSLGYCAEIAGMKKEDFVTHLGKKGISIFDFESYDEFEEEAENA